MRAESTKSKICGARMQNTFQGIHKTSRNEDLKP